jgi:carbon storage regulator CsrA
MIELNDGRTIEVVILRIGADKVRLGVKADRSIGVHRLEIYKKIKSEGLKNAEKGSNAAIPKSTARSREQVTIHDGSTTLPAGTKSRGSNWTRRNVGKNRTKY